MPTLITYCSLVADTTQQEVDGIKAGKGGNITFWDGLERIKLWDLQQLHGQRVKWDMVRKLTEENISLTN